MEPGHPSPNGRRTGLHDEVTPMIESIPDPMSDPEIPPEALAAMLHRPAPPTPDELDALRRLIGLAKGGTGQSRRVADFLLSWWNAGACGGFDMTNLWAVDHAIAQDMVTIFRLVARVREYPPQLDEAFEQEFRVIVHVWRPELGD